MNAIDIGVFEVEFDGIDKCGKDTLVQTMFKVFPNYCAYQARGLLSQNAYSILYNRPWTYPVTDGYKSNSLFVYLDVEKDDWLQRLKDSNEIENNKNRSDVDFVEDYEKHRGAFEKAWDQMFDPVYEKHFMKINTSKYNPTEIAEMVAARLKELNSIGD